MLKKIQFKLDTGFTVIRGGHNHNECEIVLMIEHGLYKTGRILKSISDCGLQQCEKKPQGQRFLLSV